MEAVRNLIKGILNANLERVKVLTSDNYNSTEIIFFENAVTINISFEQVCVWKAGGWFSSDRWEKTPYYTVKTTVSYPNIEHTMQVHESDELVSGMWSLTERRRTFDEQRKRDKFENLTKKLFSDDRT